MRLAVVLLLLLLCPVPAAAADANAADVARKVQRFYDRVKSYQAVFRQVFVVRAQDKKVTRTGRVSFARGSRLSFRYAKPHEGVIVCDGKRVRIWEKVTKTMYESELKRSPYKVVLAFLRGGGKLKRDFRLRLLDPGKPHPKAGHILEAIPRQASPSYEKVLLFVDARTGQVHRVLILDAQGNSNRFELTKAKLNPAIPKREFLFSPPRGTKIVKL